MALRVSLRLLCLLGASMSCAGGASPDENGLTFGVGAGMNPSTAAASASDSESGASEGDAGTDGDGDSGEGPGSNSNADDSDPSAGGDACGNGVLDAIEECDGAELGGADCAGSGFASGALACSPQCTLDTSACVVASCGDATLQPGEICDCGMAGSACSGAQLGDQSCASLAAPSGGNYSGGTLGCTAQCTFDESGCTACGDGALDAGEECDGANLAGQSCTSQGFDAGSLSCGPACVFNTGACVNYVCGNASCDPGEDSCSCPGDCPDDPNSCGIPCECGSSGGNCYCDDLCVSLGDCCANGPC